MSGINSVEKDYSENATHLYIFFGGIAAGIAMPPFEFYNAAKIIDEHKLFIRDFSQTWYHEGLTGISKNINSTANYIKNEIKELNPEKIFFVGNSMGGFAAIVFATLIGQGEVIAFAPQTFISPVLRFKYHDNRWPEQIKNTYKKSLFKQKIWDIRPLLIKTHNNLRISIFVAINDRLDFIHAKHLKTIPGITIYEFNDGGHGIVTSLRDEGKLPAIMSGTYTNQTDQ